KSKISGTIRGSVKAGATILAVIFREWRRGGRGTRKPTDFATKASEKEAEPALDVVTSQTPGRHHRSRRLG
ncbi:MAG TPA: hypothetical protein VNC50_05490, partial [Planctomycetia bacterium]|nr:hypothetical protein [Planctomycetia bacterium]